jgi:hypothetical protein
MFIGRDGAGTVSGAVKLTAPIRLRRFCGGSAGISQTKCRTQMVAVF